MSYFDKLRSSVTSGLKSVGTMSDLISGKADDEKKKKPKKFSTEQEGLIVSDPQFQKVSALKKILGKFSNKTFTMSASDGSVNYEIPIKIEVCKMFQRILDMREDYLLTNTIGYFKTTFIAKEMSEKDLLEEDFTKDFVTLLPGSPRVVGMTQEEIDEK